MSDIFSGFFPVQSGPDTEAGPDTEVNPDPEVDPDPEVAAAENLLPSAPTPSDPPEDIGLHTAIVTDADGNVVAEVGPGEGYVHNDGEVLSELVPLNSDSE